MGSTGNDMLLSCYSTRLVYRNPTFDPKYHTEKCVAHIYYLRTQKVEEGGTENQGYP